MLRIAAFVKTVLWLGCPLESTGIEKGTESAARRQCGAVGKPGNQTDLPVISCVTLTESLHLSEPHLWNGIASSQAQQSWGWEIENVSLGRCRVQIQQLQLSFLLKMSSPRKIESPSFCMQMGPHLGMVELGYADKKVNRLVRSPGLSRESRKIPQAAEIPS